MSPDLQRVLEFLNRRKLRATYKAVGDYLHIPQRSVGGALGAKKPAASWVVSIGTGRPTGYSEAETDPELLTNEEIISTAEDLRFRMRREGR